jgi:predicted nucleotidyltransferase
MSEIGDIFTAYREQKPVASAVTPKGASDMKAFITGSRAYGTPREDSDTDLVVMVSPDDMRRLRSQADITEDDEGEYPEDGHTGVLRFGKLNLLCVTQPDDYEAWREGTAELIARRPVTREEAVEVFTRKREAVQEARDAKFDAAIEAEVESIVAAEAAEAARS